MRSMEALVAMMLVCIVTFVGAIAWMVIRVLWENFINTPAR